MKSPSEWFGTPLYHLQIILGKRVFLCIQDKRRREEKLDVDVSTWLNKHRIYLKFTVVHFDYIFKHFHVTYKSFFCVNI